MVLLSPFSTPVQAETNMAELSDREKLLLFQRNIQTFQENQNSVMDFAQGNIGLHNKIESHGREEFQQNSQRSNFIDGTQERQFPDVPTQFSVKHPEILLNQLSLDQKHKFLSQFEQLSEEQQRFAYNKFLTSPQEIQVFAINQFLSLDNPTLSRALQSEIIREQEIL